MIKDIPLVLVGYNRPELIEKRLKEISAMPISKLYINIDFESDEMIQSMQNIINNFENNHKNDFLIEKNIQNRNLGLNDHIFFSINKCLEENENFILVEDDIKLSPNFYNNMLNGFNLQSSKQKLGYIGGFSPLNLSNFLCKKNYWRKTIYFSCWGWGTNKKTWSLYQEKIDFIDINQEMKMSKTWKSLNSWQRYLWLHRFRKMQMYPKSTWDIQFQYISFLHDFYNLVPVSRFVDNEGYSDVRASHTIERKPFWFKDGFENVQIQKQEIPEIISRTINKLIDSNTVAGDGRLTKMYLDFKNKWNIFRK
jgi:hypothetical protein